MMMIKTCTCEHKFQDKMLGKYRRWMNKLSKTDGFSCTVCGKIVK